MTVRDEETRQNTKANIMNRRFLLAGIAVAGTAPAILAAATRNAFSATSPTSLADVKKAPQYYAGVIGRAEISLATSQLAVEKAKNKNAHEFAGFELGEAVTVNMVLKDIGVSSPAMGGEAMTLIEKIKSAKEGTAFDQAYITLQLENHEALRDLADAYLHNSAGATDPDEKQGRHLAALMLAVFKEHVAICKRISGELET
jgi:predicted outer membrane protein